MGGKTPAGLVITGGGAMTYGLADTARKILNMQARIAIPQGLTGLVDEIKTPVWTVAGLLMLAAKEMSSSNLVSNSPNSEIFYF